MVRLALKYGVFMLQKYRRLLSDMDTYVNDNESMKDVDPI